MFEPNMWRGETDLHPKFAVLPVFRYTYSANPAVERLLAISSHMRSLVRGSTKVILHCMPTSAIATGPQANSFATRKVVETDDATPTSPRRVRSPQATPPFPTDSPASLGAALPRLPHPCTHICLHVRVILFVWTSCLPRTRMGV
jgi:hypothetical protein